MKSKGKFLLTIIAFFTIVLFSYLFYKEGVLPVEKNDKTRKIFVINPGEDLTSIIGNLEKEGFIRNKIIFFFVVKTKSIEKKIQAGDFRLSRSMNTYQIAEELTHGTLDVWITIKEGVRKEEVAELIVKLFNVSEIEFDNKAQEGYLFPDTYLIPKKADVDTIIAIFTRNFKNKFNEDLQKKAKKTGLTEYEVLTIASIVERESKFDEDRIKVAGVLRKRLEKGIPLQADATVQYALGYHMLEKSWWKVPTIEDLKIQSVYNTYVNPGLPPGPISNPGLASIKAVVESNPNTPYLFYVSDKKGKLHFARNTEEHEANQQKYLKYLR